MTRILLHRHSFTLNFSRSVYTIFSAFPMLYVCNLGNYANMQITKIAQGCQGGKQAEFSIISI